MTAPSVMPEVLCRHLRRWVGDLPGTGVRVVAHAANARPGWDGARPLHTGVADPHGNAVVAVRTVSRRRSTTCWGAA
jgi:hypothetical protein